MGFGLYIIGAGCVLFVSMATLIVCTICMTVWDGIAKVIDRYFDRRVARRGYRLPPPGQ